MADELNVVAIVVTYNRKALLCEVLDALLGQDCGGPDILIIDNHSTDGTKAAIEPYLAKANVFYKDTGENLGGAGGFHCGLKTAVQMGYDRLWMMDDDCVPDQSALSALLQADRQIGGRFGWLSSIAYWTDGEPCKMNKQKSHYWKRANLDGRGLVPAQFASFVSCYVAGHAVRDMGLVIPAFYIWGDDTEFTRRVSMKYPCFAVPDSRVTHKMAQNHGVSIADERADRLWRYRYAYRNEVYIMKREGLMGFFYFTAKIAYHTMKILLFSKSGRLNKLGVVYKSVQEGFRFNPEVEYIQG